MKYRLLCSLLLILIPFGEAFCSVTFSGHVSWRVPAYSTGEERTLRVRLDSVEFEQSNPAGTGYIPCSDSNGVTYPFYSAGGVRYPSASIPCVWSDNIGQTLVNELIKRYPIGVEVDTGFRIDRTVVKTVCVGFGKTSSTRPGSVGAKVCNAYDGEGEIDPPEETVAPCTVSSQMIKLNHGALSSRDVANNTTTTSLSLTCTESATYTISAGASSSKTDGEIPMSGNITSKLYDVTTTSTSFSSPITKTFKKGTNTLQIQSRLETNGKVTGGNYSGSGVLIFSLD
ncbi:hypothetical protein F6T13_03360 [Escherichia coli]|nr:hypothetical protein [Escherichia coli]EFD4958996.1 hypothetical protein [Escherichia coli]EGF7344471.1 fimbrial major subunit CsuA/B family protein [Escherichia coli]EGF7409567.1 hypothetical protein [Escherichia coli]EGF7450694.1 hypothetical protein [Escherichia coli]